MKYYLDTSFIVEAIKGEGGALSLLAKAQGDIYSSQLGRTETLRTFTRFYPDGISDALIFFNYINLIDIDNAVLRNVESYGSHISLKTSDAIHLSTAQLLLGADGALITFDKQMALNADRLGIKTLTR